MEINCSIVYTLLQNKRWRWRWLKLMTVVEVNQYVNTLTIQPELKAQPKPKGQSSCSPKSDQLVSEYSDVFQGIGKIKDFQLDLHIN